MIKYKKDCKVCIAIKQHPKLADEIFRSKFYLSSTGPSLRSIAIKYSTLFNERNLTNHVHRHQFMSEVDYTKRHLNNIAKDAEKQIIKRSIESNEVFDGIIDQGMAELQAGNLKVDTKDLLSAAKFKKEFQLKEQDQQLAMAEMVFHFASGENNKSKAYDRRIVEGEAVTDYDPTAEPAADTDRRQEQSRAFYQSLAGDASTPRSD